MASLARSEHEDHHVGHDGKRSETTNGEKDGSPRLLRFQIDDRVCDACDDEDTEDDLCEERATAENDEDEPYNQKRVDAGGGVFVRAKNAGDRRRIDWRQLGAEARGIFFIDGDLGFRARCRCKPTGKAD